jgi:hypothetical protein
MARPVDDIISVHAGDQHVPSGSDHQHPRGVRDDGWFASAARA